MLFTEDNFRDGEMKMLIPVSTGLSWQKLAPSLAAAQHDYLLPLLGKRLNAEMNGIYLRERTTRSEAESEALLWARRAVANLALWSHFDALNLRISDQGFQRQGSEDWQPAYKYQEDALRRQFAHDGFNALDALLVDDLAPQDLVAAADADHGDTARSQLFDSRFQAALAQPLHVADRVLRAVDDDEIGRAQL
jgi:hypothetical protein